MPRPFRFGVQVSDAQSADDWRDKARRIEDLGYSTLTMPDHFVDTRLAPLPAMAMAAAHTTTLTVGSLVFDNDFKHPAILAKEMATIDVLSGGRTELGIGAGWMIADYEALGIPYDRPGVRIDRLREAIAVIKHCWLDGPFTYEGEHYRVEAYDAVPKPVREGGIPLQIGGGGRRMLTLAAHEADIVGINPNLASGRFGTDVARDTLKDRTDQKVAWVREAAGDRWGDLELQVRYFMGTITDDARRLAETLAPAFDVSPEDALEAGMVLAGTVEECIETLQRRREEWGVSYVVFGDDNFEAFAPVVAALAGT